jgi:LysR family positive regulator for ilvC
MKNKELQLFLHLAKTLSYARTSLACHVSPSSLSRVIQRLEEDLGHKLFERNNRSVEITPAGKAFRTYASGVMDQWLKLKEELQSGEDLLRGEISLYCSVTASYSFLYELLSRFRTSYPAIELKLHTGDPAKTLERIRGEKEDVGIAALPDQIPQEVQTHTIGKTPLVFIVAQDYCLQGRHWSQYDWMNGDWDKVPMILSEQGVARQQVENWWRRMRRSPSIYAQVAGNEAIVSMVSLGFGVGLVPKLVVENSPLAQNISTLAVSHDMQPYAIGVCALRRKLNNPLIKAFWEQMQNSNFKNSKNVDDR